MTTKALEPRQFDVVSSGSIDEMMDLPNEIFKHGDNVYFVLDWEDPSVIPEVVGADLESRLRAAGCVPADGETCMVQADPNNLRLVVNYREQTPEFAMIASIIGAVGLAAVGAAATVFRTQTENLIGVQTNNVLMSVGLLSALLLGGGLLFTFLNPRGMRALRG